MQILDIEMSDHAFDAARGRHSANVGLVFADHFVSIFCSLALPDGTGTKARDFALLNDALRQLRRMPEFRTGRVKLAPLPVAAAPLPMAA